MPSEKDFRRIALGLDGALESSHMGHPDFRAHGRIFVTLQDDRAWGGLMLTPDQQKQFLSEYPDAFKPAAGAWGVGGATLVHLPSVDEETLGEAITMAFQNAAAKAVAKKTKKGSTGRTGGKGRKGKR